MRTYILIRKKERQEVLRRESLAYINLRVVRCPQIDQLDEVSRSTVKRIIKALANEKKMRELLSQTA